MSTYQERKEWRRQRFWASYGKKLVPCSACNGTGYYDNTNRWGRVPKCGSCGGSGKERER